MPFLSFYSKQYTKSKQSVCFRLFPRMLLTSLDMGIELCKVSTKALLLILQDVEIKSYLKDPRSVISTMQSFFKIFQNRWKTKEK